MAVESSLGAQDQLFRRLNGARVADGKAHAQEPFPCLHQRRFQAPELSVSFSRHLEPNSKTPARG